MPDEPAKSLRELFSRIMIIMVAAGTFVLAGSITGKGPDVSLMDISRLYFVAGIIAFPVLLILNRGRSIKFCAVLCMVISFLPEILCLSITAIVLGIPFLIVLIFLRLVLGKKIFDKALDSIAGFFLKIGKSAKRITRHLSSTSKNRVVALRLEELLNQVPADANVLSADLCSKRTHEECRGFELGELRKHNISRSQVGKAIFCTCSCHEMLRRRLVRSAPNQANQSNEASDAHDS